MKRIALVVPIVVLLSSGALATSFTLIDSSFRIGGYLYLSGSIDPPPIDEHYNKSGATPLTDSIIYPGANISSQATYNSVEQQFETHPSINEWTDPIISTSGSSAETELLFKPNFTGANSSIEFSWGAGGYGGYPQLFIEDITAGISVLPAPIERIGSIDLIYSQWDPDRTYKLFMGVIGSDHGPRVDGWSEITHNMVFTKITEPPVYILLGVALFLSTVMKIFMGKHQ